MKILFYGDSVTDASRNREDPKDLGVGYPKKISDWLKKNDTDGKFEILNRGVSGDKTDNLLLRLETDCLLEYPDLVSILIGINDTWHNIDKAFFATEAETKRFEKNYRELIEKLLPLKKPIILMEPFLLPHPVDRLSWRKDLDPKIQVVRQMALDYSLPFVSLDGLFHEYAVEKSCEALTGEDGVHPTDFGFEVITQAWLTVAKRNHLI